MPIEQRGDASVVTHALARDELTRIRNVETEQVAFRKDWSASAVSVATRLSTVGWKPNTRKSRRR